MGQQLSIFDTPLDPYETEILALRSEILQRADGFDREILPQIICMVARKHADDPVRAVADEITEGLDLSQERQQRIAQGIAAITKTFAPDMRRFNGIYIQAACRRNGPWTSRQGTGRQAWREYVNNLIDLFEYGEKGRTPSQPPGY